MIRHLAPAVLIVALLGYTALLGVHAWVEIAYDRSRFPGTERYLAYVPGLRVMSDSKTFYCVDFARRNQGPPVAWIKGLCNTGPIRRVTIQSLMLNKSWAFYLGGRDRVRFKTSSDRSGAD